MAVSSLRGRVEGVTAQIVVVDDEPDILDLVCSVLRDEGYSVLCLSHPDLTADLKGHEPLPRLFLLDVMLPTMSGIDLARRLQYAGFDDIPMIAMSASPTMLDAATGSELFVSSLSKPFDLDTLLDAVGHHVRVA
jgi:two-component system, OmpR family, response regulator